MHARWSLRPVTGLYLVSRICRRLGWKIETHSAEGAGTTFRVLLGSVL